MEKNEQSNAIDLLRAIDRLRRVWKNASPGTTINKSQFFTLMALYSKGRECFSGTCGHPEVDPYEPITLSTLAKIMRQSMPAVSQRITQLEEMGYVQRKQDQNDRRTVWITLTEQGNSLLQDTCHTVFHRIERVMDAIDAQGQDSRQMIDAFNCLADVMQQEFRPKDS